MGEFMQQTKEGIIIQSLSGFYQVLSEGAIHVTKPRGNFRHQQVKPLVGDLVQFEVGAEEEDLGRLVEVLPRRNQLIRPSVVNVDYALIMMSLVEPDFSYSLVDQFLVSVELHRIQPLLLLSKYDVLVDQIGETKAQARVQEIRAVYEPIGYPVHVVTPNSQGVEQVKRLIQTGIYVVMGQTGVGKSTLLNQLLPHQTIETGEISQYLNRGRHTTREVTLYPLNQGMVADTPGFSALEFDTIEKEELAQYFPEIWRMSEHCRFRSCLHLEEPNCAVKTAVEQLEIATSRYQSYLQLYQKIEQRKPIYNKRKK